MSGNRRVSERGHRPLRLFGLTQYLFFIRRLERRLGELQAGPLACPGLISIASGSSTAGQQRNVAQMQKCQPPARRAPPAFWGAGHATAGPDPGKEPEAMADPVVHLGDQVQTTFPPPESPAGRRPWHPSQGGAPWDSDWDSEWDSDWDRIYRRDCDCPACRRPARR